MVKAFFNFYHVTKKTIKLKKKIWLLSLLSYLTLTLSDGNISFFFSFLSLPTTKQNMKLVFLFSSHRRKKKKERRFFRLFRERNKERKKNPPTKAFVVVCLSSSLFYFLGFFKNHMFSLCLYSLWNFKIKIHQSYHNYMAKKFKYYYRWLWIPISFHDSWFACHI